MRRRYSRYSVRRHSFSALALSAHVVLQLGLSPAFAVIICSGNFRHVVPHALAINLDKSCVGIRLLLGHLSAHVVLHAPAVSCVGELAAALLLWLS